MEKKHVPVTTNQIGSSLVVYHSITCDVTLKSATASIGCLDAALVTLAAGTASVIGTGSVETPVLGWNTRSISLRKKILFTPYGSLWIHKSTLRSVWGISYLNLVGEVPDSVWIHMSCRDRKSCSSMITNICLQNSLIRN